MDIYPLGLSSFRVKGKTGTVVLDPFDPKLVGLKFPKVEQVDVVTVSHEHPDHNAVAEVLSGGSEPFVIQGPGEYEIKEIGVIGIGSYHDNSQGSERGKNTIYKLTIDGMNICHLGDLGHKLTDEQVDRIGEVDILMIPVGGKYTIDAERASEVVAQIEPTLVIPMHYKREGMGEAFEEVDGVDKFLKEMGAEGVEKLNKLTTSKDKLPENTTVVVLE